MEAIPESCADVKKSQEDYLTTECQHKQFTLSNCIDIVDHDGCWPLKLPDIQPCIKVRWGDSAQDRIETDDVEILCITVCNCYTNVDFANFNIGQIIVTDSAGLPVPTLPDGTPSVRVIPSGPICFGDIGRCVHNQPICVQRELVLYTRGVKWGKYRLIFKGVCFSISTQAQDQCFIIPVTQDE